MAKAVITQLVSSMLTCLTQPFNFTQFFHILCSISMATLFSMTVLPENDGSEASGFAMPNSKIGQVGIMLMSQVIF